MAPRKRKIVTRTEEEENTRPNFLQDPNCRKLIEIVVEAQKNDSYHEKCSKQLLQLYKKFEHRTFMQISIHCVKMALIMNEESEYGNSQLRFWAKAFCSFDSDEDTHPVLADILNWLLQTISPDPHARFRMCFFVNALLNAMGPEAQLDDAICNNIQKYMIERMRDSNKHVRLQAVFALQRLQNPEDSSDKVIHCYLYHIDKDPSSKVRQAVISSVAKNKKTIPDIIGRLWDVDEKVRQHTILQMSKYPVRSYMVAQRLRILEQALKDHSSVVHNAVAKIMLPQWIESYQKNYVSFVNSLKIDATREELIRFRKVATDALVELFKKYPIAEVVSCLELNEGEAMEKCVPLDLLDVDKVVLWHALIKYLRDSDLDELDLVLPDLSVMAQYLKEFVNLQENQNESNSDRLQKINFQFILEMLLEVVKGYDYGDEVGRLTIKSTLLDLLKSVQLDEFVVKIAVEILEELVPDSDERLQLLAEMIRDLYEQNKRFDLEGAKQILDQYLKLHPNPELEVKIRQQAMKILELREQESSLMSSKDYTKAHDVGQELESSIDEYKSIIKPILESSSNVLSVSLAKSLSGKRQLSKETLIKCVQILFYTIASKKVHQLTPATVELYRKLICVYFEYHDNNLRSWVLKTATACAMLYEVLSKEVFDSLWRQFVKTTSAKIWKTTFQCMFELLDRYGLDHFDLEKEQSKSKRGRTLFNSASQDEDEEPETTVGFMNFIAHLYDNCEDASIRSVVVHGYCRLTLRGHLSSSEIVSKLLLKYFNPATENEVSQALGIFFEKLIERRRQELLQQALLPTLNAILDAPKNSPLVEIDTKKVMKFVIQSTKPEFCAPGLHIHNTLALSFLSTIKDSDEETHKGLMKLLVSGLLSLEISEDAALRADLKSCVGELLEKFQDPKTQSSLLNFKKLLDGDMTSLEARNSEKDDDEFPNNSEDRQEKSISGVFKVPLSKTIPEFMSQNLESSKSPIPNDPQFHIPDTPNASAEDEELSITPFEIPATQESVTETPEEAAAETPEEPVVATQEEVALSPNCQETVWGKTKKRGIKLTEKARENLERSRAKSSSMSPASKVPKKAAPVKETTESIRSSRSSRRTEEARSKSTTPKRTAVSKASEAERSKSAVQEKAAPEARTRSQKPNEDEASTPKKGAAARSRSRKAEEPSTPKAGPISRSRSRKEETTPSRKQNEPSAPKTPVARTRSRTQSETPEPRKPAQKPIDPPTPMTPEPRTSRASTKKPATPKTAPTSRSGSRTPKTPASLTKRKVAKTAEILPQSPLGLIGTRSLATRGLRSKAKK